MMQFLTGMYDGKIDDKGRLSLPARLRNALSSEQVVILPGLDGNHLMLMTPLLRKSVLQANTLNPTSAYGQRKETVG